ncbi:MAG: CHAT domain-containing protein [candidate division KSB1 bacterium]|nr:CHAT domain-containing protein [candidate division KSB1 bacterium]MDZ7272629.1 CHAT domain-containing protein [candidate division KSB1 bacterium]MDZ7284349.1 CHAT domain-containing protein [candidate division KSB1 bacterium]MDZ7297255.1 CHAT domain-containing protein [candidate division KSB1 bacterium]MDZ7307569.1 CHAT domain-containing protein [candidate division KSB1 bacterium]
MVVFLFLAIFCTSLFSQTPPLAPFPPAGSQPEGREVLLEPHPMTSHPEADIMPALSPDGRWLVYVSRSNKNYDLWAKPAAGGQSVPLTTHTSDDYSPAWSPDGKFIVFLSRRDDAEGDLFLLRVTEQQDRLAPGKLTRLTNNFEREASPVFSPDGRMIAFSRGASGREKLWLYHLKTKVSHPLREVAGSEAAWSPDGRYLAVVAPVAGHSGRQVFIVAADGGATEPPRQVTFVGDNRFPSWSPRGDMLVVQRTETTAPQAGTHLRLVQVRDDSGRPLMVPRELQITPGGEGALFPHWGSDHAIYYAADHYGNLDLWRIPESGMLARYPAPGESIAFARRLPDHELAILTLAAIAFDFPDSTRQIHHAAVEMGRRFLALGDTIQALAIWSVVLQEDARREEAAALAEVELAAARGDVQLLSEITQRRQSWPEVQARSRLALGRLLLRQNQRDAAVDHLLAIARDYPEQREYCFQALLQAGEALAHSRRLAAAEEAYLKIVTLFPEQWHWQAEACERLVQLALSHAGRDTLATYQLLSQRYATRPEVSLTARFHLAQQLAREGELALATNEYHDLLARLATPHGPYLQNLADRVSLALLRLHLADHELPGASQVFEAMRRRDRRGSDQSVFAQARAELVAALIARGRVLLRGRDAELALALFRQAREYDPSHLEAHRGYLEAMHRLENIAEAVAEYERRNAATPDNDILLYSLGLAYSYQGENDVGLLRRSCALIERSLAINYRLVPAYLTLGFNYEAIENLEQQERRRKKGFFEKITLAAPRLLDNAVRALTLQKPRPPARWYEKAIDVLTTGIAVNDEKAAPLTEANLALNLANNYYNLGEFGFENALRYYLIKLQYDSSFVSPRQKAVIYERAGQCAWVSGRPQQAVFFLKEAVALCRSLRDADGELRNLNRLALVYEDLGDHESSNEYYNAVLAAGRREYRNHNQALVLRNLAHNHLQNEETEEAIQKSDSSLALLRQRGDSGFPRPRKSKFEIKLLGLPVFWMHADQFGESSTEGLTREQEKALLFSIIGASHEARKELPEALAAYEQKVAAARQRQDRPGEAIALNNLGSLWYSRHAFDKALACFEASFQVCQRYQIPAGKIVNLINLGSVALQPGQPARRADSLLRVIEQRARLLRPEIEEAALVEPRQKVAIFNLLGSLHYNAAQRSLSGADEAPQVAVDNSRSGLEQHFRATWNALAHLAQAAAAFDTALALAGNRRLFAEEVIVRRNLASLFVLAQDYPAALPHLEAAHELSIEKNLPELTWRVEHALGTLARLWRGPQTGSGGLAQKSAREWYFSALDILEGLPIIPEGIEQRLSQAQEQRELYEDAILLLAGEGDSRAALELSERRRAQAFAHLVAMRYLAPKRQRHRLLWGEGGGEAPFLQRKISSLRGELRKLEAEEPQRPKELARVRAGLAQAEDEYRQVIARALAENPQLASFFSVQTVALRTVQDSLEATTAVLSYFVGEKETIIWCLNKTGLTQTRLPLTRAEMRQRVQQFRQALLEQKPERLALATALGELLLAGVPALADYSNLIIIPDDCLHYLPFGALSYRGQTARDLFGFTKVASLAAFSYAQLNKNLNAGNILVLQDATEGGSPVPLAAANGVQVRQGEDWRTGEARQAVQSAGILQINHQFLAEPAHPLSSGLRLLVSQQPGGLPATVLFPLHRMFELDLAASLVVLPNTAFAFDGTQSGEELIALERCLIYCGTPSLVRTQWRVSPEARATFLAAFYAALKAEPAITALAVAQAAVREHHPQSPAWAAFELVGFAGMTTAEKNQFAASRLDFTVAKGTQARQQGDYTEALRYYQSALTMAQQLGRQEYVQRLEERIKESAVAGRDFVTACAIEERILAQALAAGDQRQMARSYRNLSVWRRELKDYAAAEAAERKNLALAEQTNNVMAQAGAQFELAKIAQARNDYAAATHWAEQSARLLAEQRQPLPRLLVQTLLGKLALEADRYNQALAWLQHAIREFTAVSPANTAAEKRALAVAQQLTGIAFTRLAAYREALPRLQQAVDTFTALADTANLAAALQSLAESEWLNGDYQNALRHQQQVLKLTAALRDPALDIRGHNARGLILMSLGELEQALEAEKHALQLALAWEEEKPVEAKREQATVYKNLGLVYIQQKQFQPALTSFLQARSIDQQFQFERGLLYDCNNLGRVYHALGQSDSALHYLNQAEALAAKLGDQRALVQALYTRGMLQLERGQKGTARRSLQHALTKAEEIALEEWQWRCLWQLARLAQQADEPAAALAFYQRAIAGLERQSARIKVEEFRSGFIDDKSEIYEEAVLLLLGMKREAEALQFAERAKSRSFADLLANSAGDWQAGAGEEFLARRTKLLDQISFTHARISALQQNPSSDDPRERATLAALQDSLAGLQKAYADLLVEMKTANPELADLVSVEPMPVSSVQGLLPDSVALVEYFFAKDRLVSWVVDRQQVRAVTTPLERAGLSDLILQLRKAITKRASVEGFSRQLYDKLILPIAPLLQAARQLLIVPHGPLHYVPFAALQRADSTYLIDTHALALAPSATVLGFCHRKGGQILAEARRNYRVLALGNPAVGEAKYDLPFAAKEIESLQFTFGDIESYTRAAATPAALTAGLARANLVHLSCHGVYDERNPLFSALLLAPSAGGDDGRLEAHEIFNLRLRTYLVMLSACETGLARVTGGDEVIGLARAFLFAGTPALIASLWTVDDLATAITVKRFYRYLAAGASKAEALRQAQRFVRDYHNRHPAYWASFGLTGDWR